MAKWLQQPQVTKLTLTTGQIGTVTLNFVSTQMVLTGTVSGRMMVSVGNPTAAAPAADPTGAQTAPTPVDGWPRSLIAGVESEPIFSVSGFLQIKVRNTTASTLDIDVVAGLGAS